MRGKPQPDDPVFVKFYCVVVVFGLLCLGWVLRARPRESCGIDTGGMEEPAGALNLPKFIKER